MGKKIVRLTESDLVRIVKRVLKEQEKEPQVGDLLSNLDKFPQAPNWIDTFLKFQNYEFSKYINDNNRSRQMGLLNNLGCTDMKKCVDELNRYGYELNKAYKRVDQELEYEMRNRIGALLNMVEDLRDRPPTNTNTNTDTGSPTPPNNRPNRPRPNKEPFRPGKQ
jgi:hypothetical protein